MKRAISVKSKLAAGFVLLFLLLAVLFTFYLAAISNRVYRSTLEGDIKELIMNDAGLVGGKSDGLLSFKEGFIFEYSGINVAVYSKEGALIAGTIPIGFTGDFDFQDGQFAEISTDEQDFLAFDLFYPLNWEEGIWLRGIAPLSDHSNILKNLTIAALLTLPLFLVLAGILGYFISKRALWPLDLINQKAKSINDGDDLKSRIALSGGSLEFQELSSSMDEMLSRLEAAFEKEKRFTSDVSHELRTPVSVIKGAAEYSLKYDGTQEEWRQSMEMVHKNSGEMAAMIESLLSLSRMESGTIKLNMAPLDLGKICENLVRESFTDTKISVEDGCQITGDETLIKSIISNLLGNAYKYGGEGVLVSLLLEKKQEGIVLSIKDTGPGIPKENLPFIFDRFYRVDDARSGQVPGAGLGLSLVRECVRIHDGEISVHSMDGLGTEFKIIFSKLQ